MLLYMCTLDESLLRRYQKTRPCLTGDHVYKHSLGCPNLLSIVGKGIPKRAGEREGKGSKGRRRGRRGGEGLWDGSMERRKEKGRKGS